MPVAGFQKILLITPPVKTGLGPVRPNIGLGYLAQILLENNISYDVLDLQLGYSLADLKKKIRVFSPDLLGIGIFSNGYQTAFNTLRAVKKCFSSLKIVAGGPHVSCLKEQVLADCPQIDYGIILEGEEALLELCQGRPPEQIGNLIYRDQGNIRLNPTRPFISNLDALPFPTYRKFELDKYTDEKSLICSRGCPYECIYCAVGSVSGKQVRLRSPSGVVAEIEYWYKKGHRQFSFQDDNFTLNKENVLRICAEIKKKKFTDVFFRCAGSRANSLDRDLLERMKEAGFKTIAIGVEVGNDRMLQVIKKGEKFEAIDRAVRLACQAGLDVYLHFLSGVPQETFADIREAAAFALKYPVFYAEWSNTIPYPGTPLYDRLLREKKLLVAPEKYLNYPSAAAYGVSGIGREQIFATPELSAPERKAALRLLRKTRKKILRQGIIRRLAQLGWPRGLRNCAGYLIASDLISKYLFQTRLRNIADRLRFRAYSGFR